MTIGATLPITGCGEDAERDREQQAGDRVGEPDPQARAQTLARRQAQVLDGLRSLRSRGRLGLKAPNDTARLSAGRARGRM